ncbi:MAG: hypothetical protein WBF93_12360 [Pirellulales bacterium]
MDDPSLKDIFDVSGEHGCETLFASPAFLEFERRLDEDLKRLVARWAHRAAPAATHFPHWRLKKTKLPR